MQSLPKNWGMGSGIVVDSNGINVRFNGLVARNVRLNNEGASAVYLLFNTLIANAPSSSFRGHVIAEEDSNTNPLTITKSGDYWNIDNSGFNFYNAGVIEGDTLMFTSDNRSFTLDKVEKDRVKIVDEGGATPSGETCKFVRPVGPLDKSFNIVSSTTPLLDHGVKIPSGSSVDLTAFGSADSSGELAELALACESSNSTTVTGGITSI